MKRIHLLLIFLAFSIHLPAQKYISAYAKGDYEKSLSLAEKAIDKDAKDLNAYLIKAMSNLHLGTDSATRAENSYGVESALSTYEYILRKDKQRIFISAHQTAFDSISNAAFTLAQHYYTVDQKARSQKMLDKLINIQPQPEYFFLQGEMLYDEGDVHAAIQKFNDAAAKIYLDHKKGIYPRPELEDVFIQLGDALYAENDYASGNITFNRAMHIFHTNEVEHQYLLSLRDQFGMLNDYTDTAFYIGYLHNLDTIPEMMIHADSFEVLKWNTVDLYYHALMSHDNYFAADSLLGSYVCSDHRSEYFDKLLHQIISATAIKNTEEGSVVADAREQTRTLVKLNQCLRSGGDHAEALLPLVDSLMQLRHYSEGFRLLYDIKLLSSDAKKIATYENTIFQQLKSADDSLISYVDMYELTRFFPANKNFKTLQHNSAIASISKMIEEKEFSKAGILLHQQIELYPRDATINALYQEWVKRDYLVNYMSTSYWEKGFEWNGNYDQCNAGTISAEDQKIFLQRLDYVRRVAGVPDHCALRAEWNRDCQDAALMMGANGDLSHNPPKTWKCYTDTGYKGASHSNLSLGAIATDALMGQLDDDGSNNEAVGHRRWILNPYRRVFGYGSTDYSMALWALGGSDDGYPEAETAKYANTPVVWPPQWYSPSGFFTSRWSFSMEYADFDSATVTMSCNGRAIYCTVLPLAYGYGMATIVFVPADMEYGRIAGNTYTVTIKNVQISILDPESGEYHKEIRDYTYSTTFIAIQ